MIITEEKFIEKLCKKVRARNENDNYKEKEMIPLTDEENKSYEEQEACHICEGKFCTNKDDKNRKRLKITVITPENLEELLIAFAI